MKRLFIIMASAMMLALPYSCVREEFEEIPADIELQARMEAEPETKTVLSSLTHGWTILSCSPAVKCSLGLTLTKLTSAEAICSSD